MIRLLQEWTVDWEKLSLSSFHNGVNSLDSLCHSPLTFGDQTRLVNDVCPIRIVDGKMEHYLRIIPYGPKTHVLDSIIEDCDLLTYLYPPLKIPPLPSIVSPTSFPQSIPTDSLLCLMKQRGCHSEAGYRATDGTAHQVAVWWHEPSDRLFHDRWTDHHIIHIFRLSFPWLEDQQQLQLKKELHKWKRIFNQHTFPSDVSQMNLDPVDFTSVVELADIARKLINRSPDTPTGLAPVNCVQWTNQAVALSLNFPLTRRVISDLNITKAFEQYWAPEPQIDGYSDDALEPISRLPIRLYSPARVLQLALDTYFTGTSIFDLNKSLSKPSSILEGVHKCLSLPGSPNFLYDYIDRVLVDRNLDLPLYTPSGKPYLTTCPSTFLLECRAHAQEGPTTGYPVVNYVATAVHEDFVIRQGEA